MNKSILLFLALITFSGLTNAQKSKIERLTFTEADFFTEDGDYKYEEEEDLLPWSDFYGLRPGLLNVKQLVYLYSTLFDDGETFKSKNLTADVEAKPEEEDISIDFIFYGYDRYNLPEDADLPTNTDYYAPLYPLNGDTYRIVGEEEIKTPAGTFDCTVLETISPEGWRRKLWMINDKLGIYAKIIEENTDEYTGHYCLYELTEVYTTSGKR